MIFDEDSDHNDQKQLQCTDPVALIAFALFWCGMIFITAFAITFGNPWKLVNGIDSYGNICGYQNTQIYSEIITSGLDLRDKPYLFAMDSNDPFDSLWICIEKCPEKMIENRTELEYLANHEGIDLCSYDMATEGYNFSKYFISTSLGPCPVMPVPASKAYKNRCVPLNSNQLYDNGSVHILKYIDQSDFLPRTTSDFMELYKEVLCLCALAFALSGLLMVIISYFASLFAYAIFVLVIFGSVSTTISFWCSYMENYVRIDHFQQEFNTNGTSQPILLYSFQCNQKLILIFAILSTLITIFLIYMTISSMCKLNFVVELFQQTSRCLKKLPKLIFQPIFTFAILILFFILWTIAAAMLATADFINANNRQANWPYNFNVTYVDYHTLAPVKYIIWYYIWGLLWTAEFILACEQFVISSRVADWYFARHADHSIRECIVRLICYHLGSIALGSLLITLFKLPRSILVWIRNSKDHIKSIFLKSAINRCCCGCLYCLDKCIRYVHHNAYVVIAIDGKNLWPSSKLANDIVSQTNADIDLITLGGTILWLGKCGISATCGFIGILLMKDNPQVQIYTIPLLFACIFAYLIAHCFLTTCEMIIDTLFLCHCGKGRFKLEHCHSNTNYGDSALNNFFDRICNSTTIPELTPEEIALRSFED